MTLPSLTTEMLASIVPVVAFWLYSGLHVILGSNDGYRLHTRKEEEEKNLVSKRDVVLGVLLQQVLQVALSTLLFKYTSEGEKAQALPSRTPFEVALQFLVAMVVMDTWQYFIHRFAHVNRFLYRHMHSWHHRLVVPYPYGALYNHPVEGLLVDTLGGGLSVLASGMSPRVSILFFTFAGMKTVDDHCAMWLPWNPLQLLFSNNSRYHDVHHQLYGGKYNFAQPFFVSWDKIMGTYLPYELRKRVEGGFEVVPLFSNKDD